MNNTDKIVFAFVVVFTLAIFAFIIGSSFKSSNVNFSAAELRSDTPNVKGNSQAQVSLVEFSDFQCPACRTFYPLVKEIEAKYPNDVAVIYRHFPLSIHDRSVPTARASEAAAMQGKFWEYHNELFDNFDEYSDEMLIKYAENIGLDIEKFKQDINSDQVVKNVNEDLKAGEKFQIQGTPTFFLIVKDEIRPVTINQYGDLEESVKKAIEEVSTKP